MSVPDEMDTCSDCLEPLDEHCVICCECYCEAEECLDEEE